MSLYTIGELVAAIMAPIPTREDEIHEAWRLIESRFDYRRPIRAVDVREFVEEVLFEIKTYGEHRFVEAEGTIVACILD